MVLFPGTNCELDVVWAVERLGADARDPVARRRDACTASTPWCVPGGFAHGDYLRTGAIARFSPVMDAVAEFAAAGGPVVGICNGFQVLTEAGLLPGALQKNAGLTFLCETGRAAGRDRRDRCSPPTAEPATVLRIPINHFEGNYVCDADDARARSATRTGSCSATSTTPTGASTTSPASASEDGNVVGLMPHPERASDALLGSADGVVLLESLLASARAVGGVGLIMRAWVRAHWWRPPLTERPPRGPVVRVQPSRRGARSSLWLAVGAVGATLATGRVRGRARR